MKFAETINGYNAMGRGDAEYEACYAIAAHHPISGLHCHDFYELYIHYQGGKLYYVDGNVFPLRPNQLIIMPPFRMHGLVGGDELHNYERGFLYLRPATLRKLGFGQIDLQHYFDCRAQAGLFYYEMSPEDAAACKQLLMDISDSMDSPDEMTQFRNYGRMVDYLAFVCQAAQEATVPVQPTVLNEVIFDVLQYINDHFTEPLKLEDIARRFAISISYLSHEFTRYAGRSVYEYILYRRVQLAKENLLTEMSLSEVADRSGFGDYSGFLRSFRRMTGMSPNAYRKQRNEQ